MPTLLPIKTPERITGPGLLASIAISLVMLLLIEMTLKAPLALEASLTIPVEAAVTTLV